MTHPNSTEPRSFEIEAIVDLFKEQLTNNNENIKKLTEISYTLNENTRVNIENGKQLTNILNNLSNINTSLSSISEKFSNGFKKEIMDNTNKEVTKGLNYLYWRLAGTGVFLTLAITILAIIFK